MQNKTTNTSGLVISEDVLCKIASIAAMDIDGVAGMVKKPANFKGFLQKGEAAKAVRVVSSDAGTIIDIYICLKYGAKMAPVAEEVQQCVKNAVQNMTGRVVHKVNVHVEDIDIKPQSEDE